MLLVDEAHNVVEDEDALDRIAHDLLLRLEPVDDHARAQVDQLVRALGIFHQVDHEFRRAAHKSCSAERPARGDHGQNVAGIENALPRHADAVQGQAGKAVGLHFVLGKAVDIFKPVKRVVFAGRIVLPELDLGAQHRGLRRHPVLHPPRGDEDDVGKLAHDLQIGLEPELRIQKIVQVLDSEVSGNPWAIDDQRHRNLVHLLAAHCSFKRFPLFWQHT